VPEITPEVYRRWEDDPNTLANIQVAGKKLTDALTNAE